MKRLLTAALLAVSMNVSAHVYNNDTPAHTDDLVNLTVKEEAELTGFVQGLYVIGALEGPFPPYVCMYSLFWDEWYYPMEQNVRHYMSHLTKRERKSIPYLHDVWRIFLNTHGCGDYSNPLDPYHPHGN